MSGRQQFENWTGMPLRVGQLLAVSEGGATAWVVAAGETAAAPARSIVELGAQHLGCEVLLGYEDADPQRPLVLGVVRGGEERPPGLEVESDGERMRICARSRLVLQCGKASITLTAAGKVVIEGTHVLSRSAGANRIKGAIIELN